jgi:hypothetical protein
MTRAGLIPTVALALAVAAPAPAAEKMKAEEVVQKHLASVSPDPGAFSPRVVRGACRMYGKQIGQGSIGGTFVFSTTPPATRLALDFGAMEYGAEIFAFDGKDVEVGFSNQARGRRSAIATFVSANDVILRDRLLGGVLNGMWALASLADSGARVSYDGLKKLEDVELHKLKYRAKKGQNDLDVSIWLEPATFRHVATVYSRSYAQAMVGDPTMSSKQSDTYFRLEERFGEWKSVEGLAVPTRWTIRYEASANQTTEWRYELAVQQLEKK